MKNMELTKFETEFIRFCRTNCKMGCDKMKLDNGESRSSAILESCPIINFDKYVASKKKIDIDFPAVARRLVTHSLWTKSK